MTDADRLAVDLDVDGSSRILRVARERLGELGLGLTQQHAVLRALGAGERRYDGGQVELEVLRVHRLGLGVVPQALLLGICLDECKLVGAAPGETEVVQREVVDREDGDRAAVLGAHVRDRGPIGERHAGDACPVELDELADHSVLTEHLGDGEGEVGRGRSGRQSPAQLESDDPRDQHDDRLSQHGGFGLDAAHAPSEYAQSVDHGRVRIRSDDGIRIGLSPARHDHPRELLDVHLVHDARAGRNDLELIEGALSPAQELIALLVPLILEIDVLRLGIGRPEEVRNDRMVDDELSRVERLDLGEVTAEFGHGVPECGQIDDHGNAGEVLHDDTGRRELDLLARLGGRVPACDRFDRLPGDVGAVFRAQQVLEEHLVREGQALRSRNGGYAEDLIRSGTHIEGAAGVETVHRNHWRRSFPDYLDVKISDPGGQCAPTPTSSRAYSTRRTT